MKLHVECEQCQLTPGEKRNLRALHLLCTAENYLQLDKEGLAVVLGCSFFTSTFMGEDYTTISH